MGQSSDFLALMIYTKMDLLGLEDLQLKLLLENQIKLPELFSKKVLENNSMWISYRKSQTSLGTHRIFLNLGTQIITQNPTLSDSSELISKNLPKQKNILEIKTASKEMTINQKSDKLVCTVSKPRFYLTFELAEIYSQQESEPKWSEEFKTLITNYPPLSPVIFTSHKENEILPVHKYASWQQISQNYNR